MTVAELMNFVHINNIPDNAQICFWDVNKNTNLYLYDITFVTMRNGAKCLMLSDEVMIEDEHNDRDE